MHGDGTLVVWQKLDRLVGFQDQDDRQDFVRQLDEAASHIEFVFHRFLSGRENRDARVRISLNGRPLEPYDPFHSHHPATQHHPEETVLFNGKEILIRPVTLPHHDKVSQEDWKRYAGPEGYVNNQGFYLYRNRRLIVHGTWFRLAPQAELTKLSRVLVDMPNSLDSDWKLDVKKASAQPPAPVRDRLRRIVDRIGVPSKRTYTARGARLTERSLLPVWTRSQDKNRICYGLNQDHPFFAAFMARLDEAAADEFRKIMALVVSTLPVEALYADVSANSKSVMPQTLDSDEFAEIVERTWRILRQGGLSMSDTLSRMQTARTIPDEMGRRRDRDRNHENGRTGASVTDLEKLKTMVGALLGSELATQEKIREYIGDTRSACPGVTDEQTEELALWFEAVHGVAMMDGAALQEQGFEPWLEDAKHGIEPYYWERYRQLLVQRDFSAQVLATLDRDTDRTLGLLENPVKEGEWDRRGMVMGHVQSGKTANYTGLVCKAADAGYKVIVIIAGIHNNLRNQTQRRIDEGFIGLDSTGRMRGAIPAQNLVGVGLFDSRRQPNSFTTSQRDFNKVTANSVNVPLQNLAQPVVFVIKKNPNTLQNLMEWLSTKNAQRGTSTVRDPMLLIDDEADNASINIRRDQEDTSRINGQIRKLLALFDRSCYIGYTATPFANIFIDPDSVDAMLGHDLFPRDFIVSLNPPDNYFGATRVFVEDTERIVQTVGDHADLLPLKHRIDHRVTDLPRTLKTAVRVFIVARAIRLTRGQVGEHHSMLVNVSRFMNVQTQIRNEIHVLIERIRSSVRVNAARTPSQALHDPEIAALREAFRDHYEDSSGTAWEHVLGALHESVSPITVVEVNSRSSDSLDYLDHDRAGLNVIVVGGLSLSRGLTLEGLMVSYFLRNSMMYDTLLQMGRWFGYRRDYEDLCRVWMPEEAQGWYAHITESIEELRDELARMQSVNATPTDFGLRVRSHPDTLIVTARNKMGSGRVLRVMIGLANRFVETAILRRDSGSLKSNLQAAVALAENLRRNGFPAEKGEWAGGGRLIRSVPVFVVDAFLMAFRNHQGSPKTEIEPVRSYIESRRADELALWDILFAGVTPGEASPRSLRDSSLGFPLVCQRRAAGDRSDARTLMVTNRQRVSSRGVEKTGLTEQEVRHAEEHFNSVQHRSSPDRRANYPDWTYRKFRGKPLLVVHLLAIGKEGDDLSEEIPVVAWSISFPATHREEERVEYAVNTTWYQEHYGDEYDDEELAND